MARGSSLAWDSNKIGFINLHSLYPNGLLALAAMADLSSCPIQTFHIFKKRPGKTQDVQGDKPAEWFENVRTLFLVHLSKFQFVFQMSQGISGGLEDL